MYSDIHSKEISVISAIEKDTRITQRQIAHTLGVSLGMTNIIIKNLLKKGLIKTRKINRKNIHYLLTSEGIKVKSKQIYNYFLQTINSVKNFKVKTKKVILEELEKMENQNIIKFNIIGNNELADIAEIVLRELKNQYNFEYKRLDLSCEVADQKDRNIICDNKYNSVFKHEINLEDVLSR